MPTDLDISGSSARARSTMQESYATEWIQVETMIGEVRREMGKNGVSRLASRPLLCLALYRFFFLALVFSSSSRDEKWAFPFMTYSCGCWTGQREYRHERTALLRKGDLLGLVAWLVSGFFVTLGFVLWHVCLGWL
ncbi:hypothetical protein V8F33_003988 [Rhypophila sp. PSN 637]